MRARTFIFLLVGLLLGLGPIFLGTALRARESFLGLALILFGASTLVILVGTFANMRRRPRPR